MKKIFSSIVIGITALLRGFLAFGGGTSSNALPLLFVSESSVKVYDGKELVAHEFTLKEGNLEKGHEAVATFTSSQTVVGTAFNYFQIKIVDDEGYDLTSYYSINYEYGTLTVNARNITILSSSAEKVYDGYALNSETYEITEGQLPEGHELSVDFKNSITDVGSVMNYYEAKVLKDGEDVTSNFKLKLDAGTLSVKPRPIVLASKSASKVFDGKE